MAKVLVTGATGFIGDHLARRLLSQGHEVTCLVRKSSSLEELAAHGVKKAVGDITKPESLEAAIRGKDQVYHLAGCVKSLEVEELYRVNRDGTANVAEACTAQATPPVLLVVSSLSAMGPSTPNRPRMITDVPMPISNYGRSKLAGEQAARQWADQVPITIIRPPVVFGEADPATLEIFRPIAMCGVHVVPSWKTHRLSLIHAEDLVTELMLAAENGKRILREPVDAAAASQGCYFAAAEEDVTFPQMGRMIGAALGRCRTFVVRMNAAAVWTAAFVAQSVSRLRGQCAYLNIDKAREASAGSWTCSNDAAIRDFGFSVAAPLAERFAQTARWYREKHWL